MGCGGKLKRYGQSDIPASKSTLTSGVSSSVHMDRTPKLSDANGVTLILLSAFWGWLVILEVSLLFGLHYLKVKGFPLLMYENARIVTVQ